jgi:putative ABC transport system substrate-binding protein
VSRKTSRPALTLVAALFVAGQLVVPHATAQGPGRVARVGVLVFSTPTADPNLPVFREALGRLGWTEGRNVTLEYRYAEGKVERLPDVAADLVRLKPDVIYAVGGDVAPFIKRATSTIPIVAVVSDDPVESGLVASLARPGGNVTGLTFLLSDLATKWLEMLHEIAPKLSRVGILWNPDHPDSDFRETQAVAPKLGIRVVSLEVRRPDDFDGAFQTALRERADALIVVSSRLMTLQRRRILDFAAKQRLPLVTGWGVWAEHGALLVYGANIDDVVRRSAAYVDRILKGARPGDLPVERPTTFQLVINARVASGLGLSIPQSLAVRADRIIQ